MPCSFASLDKVRVEAELLFHGYDMTREHTPWEAGLGWSVSRNKGDFRGKEAALASEGKERFLFAGILSDTDDMLTGGEKLELNGQEVGVVNSPAYTHRMKKSLALVHLQPEAAAVGTKLSVVGESMTCAAKVARIP